ncbi:16S rRNA (adenine(1518)-N(6)/adenine(1519)-N(6))-dimethyltransferase RsmA [bacterium]|nr:16S rRNA (adenine(1518)-N(6)/adenine(1519)-N(6))-dimethyltransferase RsmA [bacterium]
MNTHKPKKSLGQNFLIDGNHQLRIAKAVLSQNSEVVLEIGPGQGAITHKIFSVLEQTFGVVHFVAVEKDRWLAASLKESFKNESSFHVIEADFIEWDLSSYNFPSRAVVVGNLPYNVSSQIFIKLVQNRRYFSSLFLMFQKEVALRMVAKPKTKDYGLLSLWAQLYTKPKILFYLPPSVFRPRPRVDSSFVQFDFLQESLLREADEQFFWQVIPLLYQHRRKTIASGLSVQNKFVFNREQLKGLPFSARRIEEFSPVETVVISKELKNCLGN